MMSSYPFLDALRNRRSRRFAAGLKMESGPLAFQSRFKPVPLTEEEEAALVFAANGITGHALADLCYASGEGGNMMAGLVGRTVASGDGIQSVALAVTNDRATYFLKRPRDFEPSEIPALIALSRKGEFAELYRRTRVKLKDARSCPPCEPVFNLTINRWSAQAPGTSYFLPIHDLTLLYINGLLEVLNESTGVFILDERRHFQPAGLARFARSRGGHLWDDPAKGRVATIKQVEMMVTEFATVEAGMMLQNLGLMSEALGLGGFPNFANHEFGWFQALGFRMGQMPASRYLGAGTLASLALKVLRKDAPVPYALGLEHEGEVLLKPYAPPCYNSMKDAVRAVVEYKFGSRGVFHKENSSTAWKASPPTIPEVPPVSEAAVDATIAYCQYVFDRYGRFPAHLPAFRTVAGFQAAHLDAEFYDRFYRPEALSETQRRDFARWCGNSDRRVE